VNSKTCKS